MQKKSKMKITSHKQINDFILSFLKALTMFYHREIFPMSCSVSVNKCNVTPHARTLEMSK